RAPRCLRDGRSRGRGRRTRRRGRCCAGRLRRSGWIPRAPRPRRKGARRPGGSSRPHLALFDGLSSHVRSSGAESGARRMPSPENGGGSWDRAHVVEPAGSGGKTFRTVLHACSLPASEYRTRRVSGPERRPSSVLVEGNVGNLLIPQRNRGLPKTAPRRRGLRGCGTVPAIFVGVLDFGRREEARKWTL